jgi:hypothetical protein
MIEPQTNPQAFATLRLRFDTKDGPRTAIISNISVRDASLIAQAHNSSGQHAEYQECGALVSLADHMAVHRRQHAIHLVTERASNG